MTPWKISILYLYNIWRLTGALAGVIMFYTTLMKFIPYKAQNNYSSDYQVSRYSIIDQHLALYFKNNGAGLLSPPPLLCMQSNNYPFFSFNALCQSGNKVVHLANCRIRIPLFWFYPSISFVEPQFMIL